MGASRSRGGAAGLPSDDRTSHDPRWRWWGVQLAHAVALSVLFWLVYGATNHLAAARDAIAGVPSLAFGWERHIPFVPAMIVPYMSIDLLFFASFFLCTSRDQLATHTKRITLAIILAGVVFLLLPLKMTTTRPPIDGLWGPWFAMLDAIDRPYNLAPSLHIALRSMLWSVYIPRTRGLLRRGTQAWFVLIGVSTLLTWQHHVIDVVAGQFLAAVCYYLFPSVASHSDRRLAPTRASATLASRYAAGAIALTLFAWLARPWGLVLLWPALSVGLVAVGYLGLGPRVLRKRPDGRHPWYAWTIVGWYLLGARLSWLWFRRRGSTWSRVSDRLIVGPRLTDAEARRLIATEHVIATLDLAAELPECETLRELPYLSLPMLDFTTPTPAQVTAARRFIDAHPGTVYVHCALGIARSRAFIARLC